MAAELQFRLRSEYEDTVGYASIGFHRGVRDECRVLYASQAIASG